MGYTGLSLRKSWISAVISKTVHPVNALNQINDIGNKFLFKAKTLLAAAIKLGKILVQSNQVLGFFTWVDYSEMQ